MATNIFFTYTTPLLDTKRYQDSNNYNIIQHFGTVYAQAFLEWTISIRRSTRLRDLVQVEVFSRSYRNMLTATDSSCLFSLIKIRKDGSYSTLAERQMTGEVDGVQNTKFFIGGDNDFTRILKEQLAVPSNFLKVVTCLTLPRKAFEATEWISPVPPTPHKFNYAFNFINDVSEHDLQIKCLNGEYGVSKAALWRSAPGLRKLLHEDTISLPATVSVETVRTVVTYMLSHTFLTPERIDKKAVVELESWSRRCAMQERNLFIIAVELLICRQLEQMSLEDLLELLLVSIELKLDRVETAISAVLIRHHYVDLQSKYGRGTTETELANKMKFRSVHRSNSPLEKLEQIWKKQKSVILVVPADPK